MATVSPRRWIALAAVAAVVAGLVLWMSRSRGPAPAPEIAAQPAPVEIPSTAPPPAAPSLPATPGAVAPAPPAGGTRTYTLPSGVRIRDHRDNGSEPISTEPSPPMQPGQIMDPTEVGKVHTALYPMAMACAAPTADTAADASMLVQMKVHIADGHLVVDEVSAKTSGLGERAAAVESCVRSRAATINVATDHPPMTSYDLTFPYRIAR